MTSNEATSSEMSTISAGELLRQRISPDDCMTLVGAIHQFQVARLWRKGFKAVYSSGGVLTSMNLVPDIGILSFEHFIAQGRFLANAMPGVMPVVVDVDALGKGEEMVRKHTRLLIEAGVGGIQVEDQPHGVKQCGQHEGVAAAPLISTAEMCKKLEWIVDEADGRLFVIARSDSIRENREGLQAGVSRCLEYMQVAGVDCIMPEGLKSEEEAKQIVGAIKKKNCAMCVLANTTEFGLTPQWSRRQCRDIGFSIKLCPVTTFAAGEGVVEQVLDILVDDNGFIPDEMMKEFMSRKKRYKTLGFNPKSLESWTRKNLLSGK